MLKITLTICGIILSIFVSIVTTEKKPCILREYPTGLVCVCNTTYCDTMSKMVLRTDNEVLLVSTSKMGLRFQEIRSQFTFTNHGRNGSVAFIVQDIVNNSSAEIFKIKRINQYIKRKKKFQEMLGFGASMSGSVSEVLASIPESMRTEIFKSLWSKEGAGLNMMRIPIGGSDFDPYPWTYAEYPKYDTTLSNFTSLNAFDHRSIKMVKELEKTANNHNIQYIGSAWSPPKWMKTNEEWSGRGFLKKQYYQTWADYHLRWLELMKAQNLNYWAITTGNEPTNALVAWNFIKILDLAWTAIDQGVWVGENLGPTIRNSSFRNIKILADDDESYTLPWWLDRMKIKQPNVMEYVDGIGYHWYLSLIVPPRYLTLNHHKYPKKILMCTEATVSGLPLLGSWSRLSRYMIQYYRDFTHWSQGWVHWNMLLNDKGGPSYQNHTNSAMIIVNTTSNAEFYKQPMFYGMAHYSKFVVPGSKRIGLFSRRLKTLNPRKMKLKYDPTVLLLAFERPDKQIVIFLMNVSNDIVSTTIFDERETKNGTQYLKIIVNIPPNSLHTLMYK